MQACTVRFLADSMPVTVIVLYSGRRAVTGSGSEAAGLQIEFKFE